MKITITMKDGSVKPVQEEIAKITYSKDESGMLSLYEPGSVVASLNTDFRSFIIVNSAAEPVVHSRPTFAWKKDAE